MINLTNPEASNSADPVRLPNTPKGWPLEDMPGEVLCEMLPDDLRATLAEWLDTGDTVGLAFDVAQPPELLGWPQEPALVKTLHGPPHGVTLKLCQNEQGVRWAVIQYDTGLAAPANDPGLYFANAEQAAAVLDQYPVYTY